MIESIPSSRNRLVYKMITAIFVIGNTLLISTCTTQKRPDNEIIFWHAMGGRLGNILSDIVEQFNSQDKEVFVRAEYMGSYSSLRQKIIASLAAGNYPDLAQSFETWTTKFVTAKRIVPLTRFFEGKDGLDQASIDDIYPVFRESNSYQGVLWALPFNKSVPVIYYNKDMFDKAGISYPRDDWSWSDFIEIARTLTRDSDENGTTDQYGYANTLSEWMFQCLLHQKGGSVFDYGEQKITFAQKPGIDALRFLLSLIDPLKVSYYSTGFNNQNDFAAQKVGMISSSCASRIYLEPVLQFHWDCVPLPRFKNPAAVISGTNIVIFNQNNEKRLEGAWRFIKYFTSTPVTLHWSLNTGYLPVRQSALELPEMKKALENNPRIHASLIQLDYSKPSPKHEVWSKARDLLIEALEQSMLGDVPPRTSLAEASQKAQKLLDRYRKE